MCKSKTRLGVAEGELSMNTEQERLISYTRHDFREPDRNVIAPLHIFVYDVPYLDGCGIFPPFNVLNAILRSGGDSGGMGPGTTWQPFQITHDEYDSLLLSVLQPDMRDIRCRTRFGLLPFSLDHDLDGIANPLDWLKTACDRHRTRWSLEIEKAAKDRRCEPI